MTREIPEIHLRVHDDDLFGVVKAYCVGADPNCIFDDMTPLDRAGSLNMVTLIQLIGGITLGHLEMLDKPWVDDLESVTEVIFDEGQSIDVNTIKRFYGTVRALKNSDSFVIDKFIRQFVDELKSLELW